MAVPGGDWASPRPPGAASPRPPSSGTGAGDDAADDAVSEAPSAGPEKALLPPDHPLMARFQTALSSLLRRQIGRLELDLVELVSGEGEVRGECVCGGDWRRLIGRLELDLVELVSGEGGEVRGECVCVGGGDWRRQIGRLELDLVEW